MEKIVFKNEILNIVFGGLLLIFAIVAYFTKLVEDYLPVIIGVVLILLSIKRFYYSFKKIVSKNATLILVIELILDFVFAGLLIYLADHVELFIGLIIYTRGVSYLIINYVATRKVKVVQYVINILYVTFGSFLMFTSYSSVEFLNVFIMLLILIVGAIYLQAGVRKVVVKEQLEEEQEKKLKEKEKIEKKEEKTDNKLAELKEKVQREEKEKAKLVSEKKEIDKKVVKPEVKQEKPVKKEVPMTDGEVDYHNLTLPELKVIAKEKNIVGVSQLKKSEIIEKIKQAK